MVIAEVGGLLSGDFHLTGQYEQVGADGGECPADGPREVERPGEGRQAGEAAAGFIKAGVGRGGYDAVPVRPLGPGAADELTEEVDFADADAVEPDSRPAGDGRRQRRDAAEELGGEVAAVAAGAGGA